MVTIFAVGSADDITRTQVLLRTLSHRRIDSSGRLVETRKDPPIASWHTGACLTRWGLGRAAGVREDRVRVLVVGSDACTWQPESTLRSTSSRKADPRIPIAEVCEAVDFVTLLAPLVFLALMFALDRVERWLADSDSVAQAGRVVHLVNPPRPGALPGEHLPVDVPSRRVA
jgi:hypothetical protein